MDHVYTVCRSASGSYLKHHGISGQKWGVRRFQNDDGTWTEAGKERYGESNGKPDRKTEKLMKQAMKNTRYDKVRKNSIFKSIANDDDIQQKKAEYKAAKKEWYKLSKGEDFDAYDEKTGYKDYGITPKQFQKIQQLDKKMRTAQSNLDSMVRAKVKDFVGSYTSNSASKIKMSDADVEKVNRFISNNIDLELYKYKQR